MRPSNHKQQHIVKINKSLRKISKKQTEYAFFNVLKHIAVRRKSGKMYCLDCGHEWKSTSKVAWHDEIIDVNCPNCKIKLKVEQTLDRVFTQDGYFGIIQTHHDHQVVRSFEVRGYYKVREPKRVYIFERSRVYINEKGNHEIIGYSYHSTYYGGRWSHGFELRNPKTYYQHALLCHVYWPKMPFIPILERNGFNGNLYDNAPADLFKGLLQDTMVETFYKLNRPDFLGHYLNQERKREMYERFWPSIKKAIKYKYVPIEVQLWFDYLVMLESFDKDLMCNNYIFPERLKKAHDKLVDKRRRINDRIAYEKLKEDLKKDQVIYKKRIQKFCNLKFEDKEKSLVIKPIKSVAQLRKESELLRHCAYASKYYKRQSSLLFSAYHNGQPVETIEMNINNFAIVQARGYSNGESVHHKEVITLLSKNISKIKKVTKSA